MQHHIDNMAGHLDDMDAATSLVASALARVHADFARMSAELAGQAEFPPPIGEAVSPPPASGIDLHRALRLVSELAETAGDPVIVREVAAELRRTLAPGAPNPE